MSISSETAMGQLLYLLLNLVKHLAKALVKYI